MYLGVPTESTRLNPKSIRRFSRNWQLLSANKYCAFVFLFSSGCRSWLGLFNWAVVISHRSWWSECFSHSAGNSSCWQSWQNLLFDDGNRTKFLYLWIQKTIGNKVWKKPLSKIGRGAMEGFYILGVKIFKQTMQFTLLLQNSMRMKHYLLKKYSKDTSKCIKYCHQIYWESP